MILPPIPILGYHRILDYDTPLRKMDQSVLQFQQEICYLSKHHFTSVSLEEFVVLMENPKLPRNKKVLLTFDDGYQNFTTIARPILVENGFTATIFVVTGLLGRESEWKDEQGSRLLSCDEIKSLTKAGFSIGSHTHTHPYLTQQQPEQIQMELLSSKKHLEDILGKSVVSLAYPFGLSDDTVQTIALNSGYQVAFGVHRGKCNSYNIWRSMCRSNENWLSFSVKLSRSYHFPKVIREETFIGKWYRTLKKISRYSSIF